MEFEAERLALMRACHRLAEKGLVIGTSGNLSLRVADDRALITPTGARLEEIEPDQLSLVDLDGNVVAGTLEPTSELALHTGVLRSRPEVNAVAHAHALTSTAVSCTHTELPALHYTQLSLGGTVRVAPYATFGTPELAANVITALEGKQVALMANHGSVALGGTIDQACERLEQLEWHADLLLRATTLGTPRVLSEADLEAVFLAALQRGYGTTRTITTEAENAS